MSISNFRNNNESRSKKTDIKTPQQKNFDEVLHKLLLIGLYLSVLLILIGLLLSGLYQQPIPTRMPALNAIFSQVLSLQASGFLSLGLLVLIATPIIRVFSSLISFLIERDWRFAGITLIVFLTVIGSILFGKY